MEYFRMYSSALTVLSFFVFLLAIKIAWSFWYGRKSDNLNFYSEATIIFWSAAICIAVITLFLYFRENSINVPDGLGQVGDFIGGLTNPILSFAALIVLLRSTAIQTRIMRVQQETQVSESFRSEFYMLLNNIYKSSEGMNRDEKYVGDLRASFLSERDNLMGLAVGSGVYEAMAKEYVVSAIRFKSFSRFAITVRMAMHHLVASNPKQMYRYATMIKDSMTEAERIVFLTWIYYHWTTNARDWFIEYKDENGQKINYGYTDGLKAEDFISDEVYKFFS